MAYLRFVLDKLGYTRATHTEKYVITIVFHSNNGMVKESQYYVTRTSALLYYNILVPIKFPKLIQEM